MDVESQHVARSALPDVPFHSPIEVLGSIVRGEDTMATFTSSDIATVAAPSIGTRRQQHLAAMPKDTPKVGDERQVPGRFLFMFAPLLFA